MTNIVKFKRGPLAGGHPAARYTVTLTYLNQPHRDMVCKSRALGWIQALNLALQGAARDPNFNPNLIPSRIKIERKR